MVKSHSKYKANYLIDNREIFQSQSRSIQTVVYFIQFLLACLCKRYLQATLPKLELRGSTFELSESLSSAKLHLRSTLDQINANKSASILSRPPKAFLKSELGFLQIRDPRKEQHLPPKPKEYDQIARRRTSVSSALLNSNHYQKMLTKLINIC